MKKYASKFLSAALLAVLVACGSDGGPDYVTEIDGETMEGAAETSFGFVQDVVFNIMSGQPTADLPLAPAFEGRSFADRLLADIQRRGARRSGRPGMESAPPMQPVASVCEAVESGVDSLGVPFDSDEDNIPDDYKLSFPANCTETEGDWTYTYSGSVRLRDVAGLYGFRVDVSNLQYREVNTATDAEYIIKVNGTEASLYAANLVEHSTHLSYTTSITGAVLAPGIAGSASAPDFTYTFYWDEETSFDPDGTISLEENIPSGDFDLDLTFRAVFSGEGESGAFRFHLTTPEELHFDNDVCEGIDDGQLRGALNSSEDIYFLVNWTGCDETTYEAHGTSDSEAAVRRFTLR